MDPKTNRKLGIMSRLAGAGFGLLFSIFWCIMAWSIGAGFMVIFGIPFIGVTLFQFVMCIRIILKEKKQEEKPDPWEHDQSQVYTASSGNGFCPYCGSPVEGGFAFCPKCGRRIQ